MELKSWQQEMRRRSQPTSSTAINEGNIGNRVNRKRNRIGHSYRTRAALNEEQEDEEYEIYTNPNNASTASASSVSSNDNDSIATDIAHEEDLCSDNTTESSTDIEDGLSTSKPRSTSCRNLRLQKISQDWKLACRQLLETLWQCEDSIPFREPVDRLEHPEYYQIINTPMDLRTVKEDLLGDNYKTPAEFAKDMRLIFTNSRKFNTNKCSSIYLMTIRLSAMFEEQMHRIFLNWKSAHRRKSTIKRETKTKRKRKIQKKKPNLSNDTDSTTKSSTEIDVEDRSSTSKPRSASSRNVRLQQISQDWKLACHKLLETLWQCEDSIYFREPMDRLELPEYYEIIDTPMDLRIVKEYLLGDNYETPVEFAKDVELILANSRNFNPNKHSSMHSMKLSAMFEEHMLRILLNWISARRREKTTKAKIKTNQEPNLKPSKSKSAPSDEETDVDVVGLSEHDDDDNVSNKEQKKIKTNQKSNLRSSKSKSAPSDEEMDVDVVGLSEHDDDEVSDKEQKKKNFDISVSGPSQMTNSHTKLSYSGLFRRALKRICRSTVAKKPKNSDSESETTSYTDSINSASVGIKARTAIPSISADTDSDSDYTDDRRKQVRKNCGKNIKNGKQSKSKVTPNVIADDDNDNDADVAESKMNEDNEENEEVILVLDSTDEESKEEKIIKRDTRSQNLTTKSVQNQKYTTNNGKNDNRDSESEEHDEEEEEELKSEEEEEVEWQQLQHKIKKYFLRSSRRSSSRKRFCYNEDSDDSTTLVKNRLRSSIAHRIATKAYHISMS